MEKSLDYSTFLKNYWKSKGLDWEKSLHDGYFSFSQDKPKIKLYKFQGKYVKNNES